MKKTKHGHHHLISTMDMASSILFVLWIILLITSIMTLGGCTDNVQKINDQEITYNGHRYLVLQDTAVSGSRTIVHDPDCPKCDRK